MIYIHNTTKLDIDENLVVTLGKFDGIHRGHQKLIEIMKEKAKEYGCRCAVFTFDSLPQILCNNESQKKLMTLEQRKEFLEKMDVDYLIEYPFDEEFMNTTSIDFIKDILKGKLHTKCIVVGTDCSFGKGREGNAQMLLDEQKNFDFEAIVVEKERHEGREISSSYVKEELSLGHMETVNILLKRPFYISGVVAKGNQLGHQLGIPTINIYPAQQHLLPPNGVYASKIRIKGNEYFGITNIGVKPTVGKDEALVVETHIFDFDEDVYGENAMVELLHFQRPEMKFESFEVLKKQMEQDISFTKDLLLIY